MGVLSRHDGKERKAILNAIEALGHDPAWLRRENTAIRIDDGEVTLEPDVDVLLDRLLLSKSNEPSEEIGLATTISEIRPTCNDPDRVLTAIHKFATAATLADEVEAEE